MVIKTSLTVKSCRGHKYKWKTQVSGLSNKVFLFLMEKIKYSQQQEYSIFSGKNYMLAGSVAT